MKRGLTTRRQFIGAAGAATMVSSFGAQAQTGAIRVRPNIATPAGQAALAVYARGVSAMKNPAINNPPQPQSWTFQAFIHGVPRNPSDPVNSPGIRNGTAEMQQRIDSIYGNPGAGTPQAAWKLAAQRTWGTCPHFSPYFLSWHRFYVLYLEQMVARMAGVADFALPYWAYASDVGSSLQLPTAFRDTSSPLFESVRGSGWSNPQGTGPQTTPMNSGGYMPFSQITYAPALTANRFFPSDTTFVVPPDPAYFRLGATGRLEIQPHDNVHDDVGGLMSNVPVAAQDPVFYVHHCMIDRLWSSWQSYPDSTMNWGTTPTQPSQSTWTQQSWWFVQGDGSLVQVRSGNALSADRLGYRYDDLVPRVGPTIALAAAPRATAEAPGPAPLSRSTAGLSVGAGGASIDVPTQQNAVREFATRNTPVQLILADVMLQRRPPSALHVFINLPAGVT
ncbi:MAG: tyrosinase family protein, partial [Alphaproteobacteria bacterium]|nr:tyrosinase family protein [Alphaproteobacteria bacterium]